jgi:RNA polymerase sigma-70 factor (ECF subfamily)
MEAAETSAAPLVQSDWDLVQRHRYGDPQAFEEVYERYGPMVFNLAYRMCGDRETAADLTQDSFLRIFRAVDRFRGRSSLKTWIYRVALNVCRSRLRRKRWSVQPLAEDDGPGVELRDPDRGPEQRAIARDEGRRVAEALLEVPEVFRSAVVLCDLQGLSYEEIAEVLGVRLGTVRSRIARGRDRLRVILEQQQEDDEAAEETNS